MNIDTKKEKICLKKSIIQKTEMVLIENDVIVPDVKPDVIKSISTCGNVCVYKSEILDGKVRVDGCVDVYIVYLTDSEDGAVRGINTTMDFTQFFEIEECKDNMNLELETCIKSIDCRVLNGRKVNLQANIEFKINIFENYEENVVCEIIGVDNIQKQNKIVQINSLVGTGETKVTAKETVPIKENSHFGEILKVNCNIIKKEFKTSYNKILAKAEAFIKIMYLTEENEIQAVETNIPLMGFIDLPNVSEDNQCDLNYLLKNIVIKPNNEENTISIDIEVEIQANVYNKNNIDIIDDLYNPDFKIDFTTKNLKTISEKNQFNQTVMIDESVNLNDINNDDIIDIEASSKISVVTPMNDKIMYEGEILLNIMYKTNISAGIENKIIELPFKTEVDTSVPTSGMQLNNQIEIRTQGYKANNNELEVQMELNISADMYKDVNIKIINTLEMSDYEEQEISSLIIYFVKPEDTLWNIAKRFRTTIDDICVANEMEDNRISVGQQLFIPTYGKRKEKLA